MVLALGCTLRMGVVTASFLLTIWLAVSMDMARLNDAQQSANARLKNAQGETHSHRHQKHTQRVIRTSKEQALASVDNKDLAKLVFGVEQQQQQQQQQDKRVDRPEPSSRDSEHGAFVVCENNDGVSLPKDLSHLMTSLLHERDVTHHLTYEADYWSLGAGAYAEVHLGRMVATGDCVVIKHFHDAPLTTIEREIRIHKFVETFLPNTPRLEGVLPSGFETQNASLVFQYVPGHTLYEFRKLAGVTTVQLLSVALQMATSMESLHRKCVLHNDFHSGNVIVSFQPPVGRRNYQLVDCGISRFEKYDEDFKGRLLRDFHKAGPLALPRAHLIDFGHATFRKGKVYLGSEESLLSCAHLAPEAMLNQVTTPAADVFSLGHELEYFARRTNISGLRDLVRDCLDQDPTKRPVIREVVDRLKSLFLNEYRHVVKTFKMNDCAEGKKKSSFSHNHFEGLGFLAGDCESDPDFGCSNSPSSNTAGGFEGVASEYHNYFTSIGQEALEDLRSSVVELLSGPATHSKTQQEDEILPQSCRSSSSKFASSGETRCQNPYRKPRRDSSSSSSSSSSSHDRQRESKQDSTSRRSGKHEDDNKTKFSAVNRCDPEAFESAFAELKLPMFLSHDGDLVFEDKNWTRTTFFETDNTVFYAGHFKSSGREVVIKQMKTSHDYFRIRCEALFNLYLNQTGWIPAFYGVVPLSRSRLHKIGLVQDKFAKGRTLRDVLNSGRPTGGLSSRLKLALQLATALHDIHATNALIDNLKANNILCACSRDGRDCSDVKLIDLADSAGCEGKVFTQNLAEYENYAPEVRHHRPTSFASDVYSLCVVLRDVIHKDVVLSEMNSKSVSASSENDDVDRNRVNTVSHKDGHSSNVAKDHVNKVRHTNMTNVKTLFSQWKVLKKLCLGPEPSQRPSTFQLKQFFQMFLESV